MLIFEYKLKVLQKPFLYHEKYIVKLVSNRKKFSFKFKKRLLQTRYTKSNISFLIVMYFLTKNNKYLNGRK